MKALLKLEFKTLFKNPASLFYVLFPVMLLLVLPPTMGQVDADGNVNIASIVSSVISISLMSNLTMTFGFALLELKKSVILKRIGSTSITKFEAMSTFFMYQILISIFSLFVIFSLVAILDVTSYEGVSFDWGAINWGGVVVASIWGMLMSLSIGFFLSSVSKNVETFNMYSMLYFFFAMFLGGLFFAGRSAGWMEYVGYIIPHNYVSNLLSNSFHGADVFNLADGFTYQIFDITGGGIVDRTIPAWRANLDLFMPLVFTIIFGLLSMKTFKWDS